jgi:SAM-dependent methyltransferase
MPTPEAVTIRGVVFGWTVIVTDGINTHPSPGTLEVLRELKQRGIVVAVVSDWTRDALLPLILKYDLLRYLDLVVTAESVALQKPHSEVLRHVLRELKLQPSETLLVEDTRDGITMGLEVGVMTVGVSSLPGQDLSRADFRVDACPSVLGFLNASALKSRPRRPITTATAEGRQFYEERYRRKREGDLPRIPCCYHADNVAFANEIVSWGIVPDQVCIADIGCGTSTYAQYIARTYGGRTCCVDISHLALTEVQRHREAVGNQPSGFLANGDAAQLPLADCSFDVVICAEVLEHVVDDRIVLDEMNRVLKAGGHLVISVPNSSQSILPVFRRLQREFNLAGHVREYGADDMTRLLTSKGFSVVRACASSFLVFWALFSIDRSSLSERIGRFLAVHHRTSRLLQQLLARAILAENRLLGGWARFGMRSLYLAQKQVCQDSRLQ